MHGYSPWRYPRWYDEGFAEYLSVVEFRGDQAVLGLPVLQRLVTLKHAGGWLEMTHLLHHTPDYRGAVDAYIRAINRPDVDGEAVFRQAAAAAMAEDGGSRR